MRFVWLTLILVISSCSTIPSYQFIRGGEIIKQPGISYVLPEDKPWAAIMRTTYQAAFGAGQMPINDTLIVASQIYNLPPNTNKENFLENIKKAHAAEPQTERFEDIKNNLAIFDERNETCIVHQSSSKDFGVEARRGGEYTIYETYGMNCIHPLKPQIGVLIELSRKAPPETTFSDFDSMAQKLLRSVIFTEF